AKLTTGMHGIQLCNQDSRASSLFAPRRSFWKPRIKAPKPACQSFLAGAGFSKRPFARPQRFSLAGLPL
ncbi:MAG TPA: hypothetical protein VFA33_12215, partial [Bryobacteraceae bacterium]|nr:hypothetical protein [Bryobacteraceae bacterium]